jgi:hypothetical protein
LALNEKQLDMEGIIKKIDDVKGQIMEASTLLSEHNKQLKRKKVLMNYHSKKDEGTPTSVEATSPCNAIERAFLFLKGKHSTSKSNLLMEAIMGGKLFNGEAAAAVSKVMWQFMHNLFRPWRLVKAGDMSRNIALEAIQVRNNVSRCIIQEIDAIIEVAVPDHSTKLSLIAAISKYKEAMEL